MGSNLKKENLLISWKEIAAYLDCDKRTCLRWEKKLSLPVHRIDKISKFMVFAYKDELDKWLVEKSGDKFVLQKTFFQRHPLQKSIYFILPVIGIPALLIYFFIFKPFTSSQPADFRIEKSSLVILSEKGKELWRYDTGIENLVDEKTYREHFQYKRETPDGGTNPPNIIIKDIIKGGKAEILFTIKTQDEFREGELFCFNHKGKLLWKYNSGREMKFGSRVYSPDFRIKGFDLYDGGDNRNLKIIVISKQRTFFPCQLTVLSNQGKVLAEYWNSGYFTSYVFVDLNEDGRKEIIVGGINNEYKKACLVVFDSNFINGGSPQSGDYKCAWLKPGTEKYYILFPRTDVGLLEFPVKDSIELINILKNKRIEVKTQSSNIYYEFNYSLELQNVRFSHSFETMHEKAKMEGRIHSELNEEYRKNLAQGFLYYDGTNWVSKLTMAHLWKVSEY